MEATTDIQLRPKQACVCAGIKPSTFWKLAKTDPDFPPLTRLGKRCTSISAAALAAYLAKKTGVAK